MKSVGEISGLLTRESCYIIIVKMMKLISQSIHVYICMSTLWKVTTHYFNMLH